MIRVVVGLMALGLVVFVHELGHFIAARLSGVTVESFSIGWGPVLFKKKRGATEYRISAFPLGGYCGMKGEHAFREALDKGLDAIPGETDGFYGAHPLKRTFIAFSGPFFNLLFAALVFAAVSAIGYSYETYENRIIPAALYEPSAPRTALESGMLEGDRIVSLDGNPVLSFSDIQQYVGTNPDRLIEATIERDGATLSIAFVPELDKKTGTGRIGVFPYVPLVVGKVSPGSAAESSGIRSGDRIVSVDETPVSHQAQLSAALSHRPEQAIVTVERGDLSVRLPLVLLYRDDGSVETGISWKPVSVTVRGTGFLDSARAGVANVARTLKLTVRGIALLFRGVELSEAVSGPVRITMMIGEVAETSLTGVAELLGVICVSLFLMNLLPIPILDGGIILFSALEVLKGRPLKPKTLYYVQFIGVGFILFIFAFALFGDIQYLLK